LFWIRDFERAATLLLESISTFTAYELMSYEQFISYSVSISMFSLSRPELKKKVVDSSDVLTVIRNIDKLSEYLNSLYDCQYNKFLVLLVKTTDEMSKDRYLSKHSKYYCREMRLIAYTQFLESYKSIKMSTMAEDFGISINFLDKELSKFISNGRLHCKIDKVGGILTTTRQDKINSQYQNLIKCGDSLLDRIHKLSRVIDL
jgi:26S proteasome regulatory subunit N7